MLPTNSTPQVVSSEFDHPSYDFNGNGFNIELSCNFTYIGGEWYLCFYNRTGYKTPTSVIFDLMGQSASGKENFTSTFKKSEIPNIATDRIWEVERGFLSKVTEYQHYEAYSNAFEEIWGKLHNRKVRLSPSIMATPLEQIPLIEAFCTKWDCPERRSFQVLRDKQSTLTYWFQPKL